MASNSFTVNVDDAIELVKEIKRKTDALKDEIDVAITKAGNRALVTARARAPKGKHTKKVPGSIRVHVRKWPTGAQFTLQTQGPVGRLGHILELGTGTSRPWLFLKAGMDDAVPPLERALMDAMGRIVDGS